MQVKTTYEVLVVECSPLDCGSSQLYRVHISHRSDSTRPAHLECHFVELRAGSLRLVFIGYSPTWTLGRITEDALLPQGVHLEHNTIGGNGKILALRIPITDIFINFFECLHFLHTLTDLESPTARFHKVLIMTVGRQFFAKEIIQIGIELTTCHESRTLALQRSARRIARIGEKWFFCLLPFLIETLKHFPWHQNLASYLKLMRIAGAGQHERDATDSLHIVGHIVAMHSIASGNASHEFAVYVCQAD